MKNPSDIKIEYLIAKQNLKKLNELDFIGDSDFEKLMLDFKKNITAQIYPKFFKEFFVEEINYEPIGIYVDNFNTIVVYANFDNLQICTKHFSKSCYYLYLASIHVDIEKQEAFSTLEPSSRL